MKSGQVNNINNAMVYLTEQNIHSLEVMASKVGFTLWEFERLVGIAQNSIRWCKEFGVDLTGTSAEEVMVKHKGCVKSWSKTLLIKPRIKLNKEKVSS